MIVAVDTSALAKLLVEETESAALRSHLAERSAAGDSFCISSLAVTELRRLALRLEISAERLPPVTTPFTVVRLTEATLQLAGRLPYPYLRTLDAIHLASALSVEAGGLLTYDSRQAECASSEALTVSTPVP